MIKTPVSGMRDISIDEMSLRNFLLYEIKKTYNCFGFEEIKTPICENISNLLSDDGWENEKLIFKILKRGEKLNLSLHNDFNEKNIIDMGLRYDLTLPLCRYYANNKNNLPIPFKSLQCGYVYRADRPQKGRYREFMQCDIDVIGDNTNLSEIDLILATSTFLNNIHFDKYDFFYEINDRRILKAMQDIAGFCDDDFKNICIIQDKYDKIGFDGVKDELNKYNFDQNKIDTYLKIINSINNNFIELKSKLKGYIDERVINNLIEIVEILKQFNINIIFNPNLVRGMGYYTGTIYEIKTKYFNSSIGGGGRYDNLIKKFTNEDSPAIGISIGFERIINILINDNYKIQNKNKQIYSINNVDDVKNKINMFKQAMEERKKNQIINIIKTAKNKKFQRENFENINYDKFLDF